MKDEKNNDGSSSCGQNESESNQESLGTKRPSRDMLKGMIEEKHEYSGNGNSIPK